PEVAAPVGGLAVVDARGRQRDALYAFAGVAADLQPGAGAFRREEVRRYHGALGAGGLVADLVDEHLGQRRLLSSRRRRRQRKVVEPGLATLDGRGGRDIGGLGWGPR